MPMSADQSYLETLNLTPKTPENEIENHQSSDRNKPRVCRASFSTTLLDSDPRVSYYFSEADLNLC
jgi:hypothetical protein